MINTRLLMAAAASAFLLAAPAFAADAAPAKDDAKGKPAAAADQNAPKKGKHHGKHHKKADAKAAETKAGDTTTK